MDDDDNYVDAVDDAADPDWLPEDEVSVGPDNNAETNTDAT